MSCQMSVPVRNRQAGILGKAEVVLFLHDDPSSYLKISEYRNYNDMIRNNTAKK